MESEQVCIVLFPFEVGCYAYYIYIVDLGNAAKETRELPAVRISQNTAVDMGFAFKDRTLYMFGGMKDEWETRSFAFELPPQGLCFDLSYLEMETQEISPMTFPKCCPRAVWIGDQICVFSVCLTPAGNNFELYDPESDKWSTLPEPPIDFTVCPIGAMRYGLK